MLLEEIRRLRQENDYVIVYVHWGIERDEKPQEYQRTMGKQYIDAGADLVIGAHPHVLQGLEYIRERRLYTALEILCSEARSRGQHCCRLPEI